MLSHPNPKHVMIAGGGELSTAREVLKHRSVERCTLVEIDEKVVAAARKHLQDWGNGRAYLEDPRFVVQISEAFSFLSHYDGPKIDLFIMDINDPDFGMFTPHEPGEEHFGSGSIKPGEEDPYQPAKEVFEEDVQGPSHPIYQAAFFQAIRRALAPNGVFVTQSTSPYYASFSWLWRQLCIEFEDTATNCSRVIPFMAHVPSFTAPWSWIMVAPKPEAELQNMGAETPTAISYPASANGNGYTLRASDIVNWPMASVDYEMANRLQAKAPVAPPGQQVNASAPVAPLLRFYDGISHRHIFHLPKWLRTKLQRIIDSGLAPVPIKGRAFEYPTFQG